MAVLACGAVFCIWRINYLSEQLTLSRAENRALNDTLEKAKNAEMEANEQIKKLRAIKNSNTETADWYNMRLGSDVIMLLSERYGKRN